MILKDDGPLPLCYVSFHNALLTKSVFYNESVSPKWREAWGAKEEALRSRYTKSRANLSHQSRPLAALNVGDKVFNFS